MPLIVGLLYVGTLALVLMWGASGFGIGIIVFLALLYALLREAPRSHLIDSESETAGHGERSARAHEIR